MEEDHYIIVRDQSTTNSDYEYQTDSFMRHCDIQDKLCIRIDSLRDFNNTLNLLPSDEFEEYQAILADDRSRKETVKLL